MAVTESVPPPRQRVSAVPTPPEMPLQPALPAAGPDLLVGFHLRSRQLLFAGGAVLVAILVAGWLYLGTFYGFFQVSLGGLGISLPEVLLLGARLLVFPLAAAPVAYLAAAPRIRPPIAATAILAFALVTAYVAVVDHLAAGADVLVQMAAMLVVAGVVAGLRRGFGVLPWQKLLLAGVGLLLLVSVPVAYGTGEARDLRAIKTSSTRVIAAHTLGLPDEVANRDAGIFTYSGYLLLRESDSRLWLLRTSGNHFVYAIDKKDVLYIRY
jgi:hypothetical protein